MLAFLSAIVSAFGKELKLTVITNAKNNLPMII
jgi:hypothetical protein